MLKDTNSAITQYLNSQVNMNSIKTVNSAEEEAEKEYKGLLSKLKSFDAINNLAEAKEKAKEIFGIKEETSFFKVGKAYVTVQNQANLLRIIVNSSEELICYNYIKATDKQKEEQKK